MLRHFAPKGYRNVEIWWLTLNFKGCGRDCTKNLGANVQLCEELYPGSDQAKDFVKCFTQASVNWANCLDACKPDPCMQKCTTVLNGTMSRFY